MVGSPQQYETTSISSVFAKHLPTVQSLQRLQGEVSPCLFNLTTKFCQSHHPAVNNEGNLQLSILKGNGDKQRGTAVSLWDRAGLSLGQEGEGREGLACLPHCSLLLHSPSLTLCTANQELSLLLPSSPLLHLKQ